MNFKPCLYFFEFCMYFILYYALHLFLQFHRKIITLYIQFMPNIFFTFMKWKAIYQLQYFAGPGVILTSGGTRKQTPMQWREIANLFGNLKLTIFQYFMSMTESFEHHHYSSGRQTYLQSLLCQHHWQEHWIFHSFRNVWPWQKAAVEGPNVLLLLLFLAIDTHLRDQIKFLAPAFSLAQHWVLWSSDSEPTEKSHSLSLSLSLQHFQ